VERWRIANGRISATIARKGAELVSLRDGEGPAAERLWQADPAWPRHAPNLFPIVGKLADDTLIHGGRAYRMTQHGFARDRDFAWEATGPTSCRLVLTDDEATRALYPFAFRLTIGYALARDRLDISYVVENPGTGTLPASIGAHPAFRWPLAPNIPKTAHRLEFEADEPAPVRRLTDGLLVPAAHPTPIAGRALALDESLFAADALILDNPASQSVTFRAEAGPAIELSWRGFRELGLWMKPGADFLCIEPWHGMASPAGWQGEFAEKPGLIQIKRGRRWHGTIAIALS
jgi:galactose mutarotase-like enzyme